MKFLVTGAAGFIGFNVVKRLCAAGHCVVGIDNINDYYDVSLKESRLDVISQFDNFKFIKMDLADTSAIADLFNTEKFNRVIHLAAQAGVRYSLENPMAYADSNLVGHLNILEGCRAPLLKNEASSGYATLPSVVGKTSQNSFRCRFEVGIRKYYDGALPTKFQTDALEASARHLHDLPSVLA